MKVQQILRDSEIISRFIEAMEPLSGPSGYALNIKYVADNATEPPVIYVNVYEGVNNCIFDTYVDQNTTLGQFSDTLSRLRKIIHYCQKAVQNKTSYDEEWRKVTADPEPDLPF